MNEILTNIDWMQVICTLWTAVLLPIITYMGKQINDYAKARKINQYTDILYRNVADAVKDVYESVVKDIKGTSDWTPQKQEEVKRLAKTKAVSALSNSVYQSLKAANSDFNEYLDGLVGTALYDLKHR